MALVRETSETIKVKRLQGKIVLEEAVGCPFFDAMGTVPQRTLIHGMSELICDPELFEDIQVRLDDVPKRLASMDQSGIAYAVVSLTSPGIEGVMNAKTAVDLARKTNDYIYEKYVKAHPDRFGFFCCVPLQDPEAATLELERCVLQLGAKGALVNGFSNVSEEDVDAVQYLDDPKTEPLWEALSILDVPLYLHPRSPPLSQQRLYQGYPCLAQAPLGFGVETTGHALRIMCSGVLDRYPNLRIILGHCGEFLPFIIHRTDQRMATAPPGSSGAHQKPIIEYFQQNFFATLAGVRRESTLRSTLDELGESRVMFSVDYPYESCEEASDWFDGLQMNENTRRALAYENARKILKIDQT